MPYARRTSFLDDVKQAWETVQEDAAAKGRKPLDKAVLSRFAEDLGVVAAGFWVRRCLRRKGAPEWVAYAVSTVDLTLTQIVVALRRQEMTVKKAFPPKPDDKAISDLVNSLFNLGGKKGADNGEQDQEAS